MKKEVKRGIYMVLLAVILFSAAMSVPALVNSQWGDIAQGASIGLLVAAGITFYKIFSGSKSVGK